MSYILGISCMYHNSAAALIKDGEIVCAAEEERFTRKKGDAAFPINAIKRIMDESRLFSADLDAVAFYENTGSKFERILTSTSLTAPKSLPQFLTAVPDWITDKLWIEHKIRRELGYKGSVYYVPHHLSHAASAFYPSPFKEAAILTIDGVGEWAALTRGTGRGSAVEINSSLDYPNSLGLLYSAFTFYTGFKINNGEYKMMGLAPYGKPRFYDTITKELVNIAQDGSFILNQDYFRYTYALKTISPAFEKLFGEKARKNGEPITGFHADVAASIQKVSNEIVLKNAQSLRNETGMKNLVMAGGVALNVTANGLLRSEGIFDDIWIQPAAGDAGGAVGAAAETYYRTSGAERRADGVNDGMKGSLLGYRIPPSSESDRNALKSLGASWVNVAEKDLPAKIAENLAAGKVVGLARGKAEFGPRALGDRSILADCRDAAMLQRLNMKIKFREGFRPFAPIVLEEDASLYFDIKGKSPYMLFTFPVRESRRLPADTAETVHATAALARSDIPSVTHIDYSARIQTVSKEINPFLHKVLTEFKKLTGYGILINTSYNTNEEPIVNTAADAYRCFMRSEIDFAAIGDRWFDKNAQTAAAPKGGW
ncbi:MAG: hypothetical protein K6C36_09360 [Clostridia bacterium]|nr:hypothetical protein [Clostridia bacterium]